jgi:tripartite-type tricarboxylate transporter receptor subunit TctC
MHAATERRNRAGLSHGDPARLTLDVPGAMPASLPAMGETNMHKFLAAAAFAWLGTFPAAAQSWPTRPVTVVVPWAAGGPVDTVARIAAARISELLGQQFIIENVGGAGGSTGTARTAKATPDGYTVLISGSAVLAQNPALYKRQLYNPVTDFEHVALHNDSARVLLVRKDFPAKTFAEFATYLKANADKLQYGSPGIGSGGHVCAILLHQALGVTVTHLPYRGAGPAMQDLIAGRIDYMFEQISTSIPQVQGGTVRALAALSPEPAPGLESLPTADSQGMKGLDCGAWGAFSFPKGTPRPIVQKLAKAISDTLDTPAVLARYKTLGVTPIARERRSPEYLAAFVKTEIERWGKPIKASGVQIE